MKRTLKRGSKALEIVIRKTYTTGNWRRGIQAVVWPCCSSASKGGERRQQADESFASPVDVSTRTGADEVPAMKVPSGGNSGGTKMHRRCRVGSEFVKRRLGIYLQGRQVGRCRSGVFVYASSVGSLSALEGRQTRRLVGETVLYDPS